MDWGFTSEQLNDGELTMSLTEFTNKLFAMTRDEVAGFVTPASAAAKTAEPMDDLYVQYFVCFYNYLLCLATDRSRWVYRSHTKKMDIAPEIKARFMDKQFLTEQEQQQQENVDMFRAVLKWFVSGLIEKGISTSRLPQMIYMQQLNSFSSILPNIMKNEKTRKMLIRIEFHDSFLGNVKRLIKLLPIGG